MRKKLLVLFLVIALVIPTAVLAAPADEIENSLVAKKADISKFPQVTLHLGLSSTEEVTNFRVLESGTEIKKTRVSSKINKTPVDVALLIDVSGSMEGKPIADALAAVELFIDRAAEDDRVAIVAFNTRVQWLAGFTSNKVELRQALKKIEATGETALYDALHSGLKKGPQEKGRRRNLILLSDGADTASQATYGQMLGLVEEHDISISVIALQSDVFNSEPLQEIAAKSNGQLLTAVNSDALSGLYDGLAAELHNQYELTFTSQAKKSRADVNVEALVDGNWVTASIGLADLPKLGNADSKAQPPVNSNRPYAPAGLWVAVVLSFLAAFLIICGLADLFAPTRNTLSSQLKYYNQLKNRKPREEEEPFIAYLRRSSVDLAGRLSTKYDFTAYAEAKLEQAGLSVKPHEYMVMHTLFVVGIALTLSLITGSLMVGILSIFIAVIGPLLAVEVMVARRKRSFNEQLPDTLDMLASSMRAGYGLQQAFAAAAREAPQPTGGEMERVTHQTQLGLPLEEALERLAKRLGNDAFGSVVLSISIHRETGGNLAEIFDILSASLRKRAAMQRQVKGLTAEGRLSAVILMVLPFIEGAFMFYANPDYMLPLITTSLGLTMLAVSIGLMLIGGFWMRSISYIDY